MITIAKQEKHSRMWKIASTWECNARRQEKDPVLFPCTWWRLTILSGTCIHAKGMGKIECARTQRAAKPGVPLYNPLLAHHHVLTSPARIFPPAPYPPCTCHPRCLLVRGINRWFSLTIKNCDKTFLKIKIKPNLNIQTDSIRAKLFV